MSEVECSSFSLPLLLDASSPKVQVGIPSASGWRSLHCSEEPALTSLFKGARSCLKSVDAKVDAIDAVFFCEGPGSTLGLRTALTFVKTLASQLATPPDVFIYNALDVSSLLAANPDAPILAEYRQGQWYLRESTGEIRVIEEAEAIEIAPSSQPVRQRKSWSKLPDTGPAIDYDLSQLRGIETLATILRPTASPTLFDLRPATFQKWIPKVKP